MAQNRLRPISVLAVALLSMVVVPWGVAVRSGDEPCEVCEARVFQLRDMNTGEAVTLMRTLRMERIFERRNSGTIAVVGSAEKVRQAEAKLNEREALAGTIVPHGPLPLERPEGAPVIERVFRFEGDDAKSAVTLLRSFYGMDEIDEHADEKSLVIRDAGSRLDAAEAMLRAFGLLARGE